MSVNLQPMTPDVARDVLTRLGRVNHFVARGPQGPTQFQIDRFVRGYEAIQSQVARLLMLDDSLSTNPRVGYRGATAADFDGMAINSTWNTLEVLARGLVFYAKRDILDPITHLLHLPKAELDTDITICTAWRAGLVEYLLGATYAIGGGYPFITYGWSRRIARMCYEDAAARAIFFGHEYTIQDAITRAAGSLGGMDDERWKKLTPDERDELIIDQVEKDLREQESFMTTEDVGAASSDLLLKLSRGPEHWTEHPWTPDEIDRLEFLIRRSAKDFVKPGGGYSVHKGAKTPGWARAAGKGAVADSLHFRGLADDSSVHVSALVKQGGRGIVVEGGREYLSARSGTHASTLMATHYLDANETDRILAEMEGPYEVGKGKEVRVPQSPSQPARHEGSADALTPFQAEAAAIILPTPNAAAPVELDFFRHEYPLEAPFLQHNGVRWRVEDEMVNLLRHGVPSQGLSWGRRAWIGFWSGLEIGLARVLPQIVHEGRVSPMTGVQLGIFSAAGMIHETVFGRTIAGRGIPMVLGGMLTFTGAATAAQAIDPVAEVHIFRNLLASTLFMSLQMPAQRALIPAVVTAYTRRVASHLKNKHFTRARRVLGRVKVIAKGLSFAMTTASSWISHLAG